MKTRRFFMLMIFSVCIYLIGYFNYTGDILPPVHNQVLNKSLLEIKTDPTATPSLGLYSENGKQENLTQQTPTHYNSTFYKVNNDTVKARFGFEGYPEDAKVEKQAMWASLSPRTTCPPHSLRKVGGNGDGGKWICHLDLLPRNCVVYSFGVNRNSEFEAEILERANCSIFAFDPTDRHMGAPVDPSDPRVKFESLAVGNEDNENMTSVKGIMSKYGHPFVDIIKMDIEQGEYDVLEKVLEDFDGLPVGQLAVEFHVWNWNQTMDGTSKRVVPLFNKLMERGMVVFKKELNFFYPQFCCEFSFLNANVYPINEI